MAEIAEAIGSQIYYCSPAQHDQAVAWISHLPVMISASLINACMQESNQDVLELAKNLASSGFRDTSRVG
ncbi:MAG: prephenate dehydrogenase dimerization domain-containing protein, partial [Microcoleaceae cyanobacterium]